MSKGKKVTVIGTGNFGSTVAFILAMNGTCHEVMLRSRKVEVATGKALDMSQAANAARLGKNTSVAETAKDIEKILDKIEEDEDVQVVFNNIK